jgi:hypothetical protein
MDPLYILEAADIFTDTRSVTAASISAARSYTSLTERGG